MLVVQCQQLSLEWFAARAGVPTASQFHRILTPRKMQLAAAADEYIAELVAEELSTLPRLDTASQAMKHGTDTEPVARRYYSVARGLEVAEVGFCLTDDRRFGCSPDGLIGLELGERVEDWRDLPCYKAKAEGCLQLKCPQGKTQVGYLLDGVLPIEYRPQVYGEMLVTACAWADFLSYSPGLAPLLVRAPGVFDAIIPEDVQRFAVALGGALIEFHGRLTTTRAKILELAS